MQCFRQRSVQHQGTPLCNTYVTTQRTCYVTKSHWWPLVTLYRCTVVGHDTWMYGAAASQRGTESGVTHRAIV